ncbi:PKD-like domain-containing protein [Chitinophaga qingshengii]|uniref:Bacteroidetes PKD-like domain-containing protein n=1 Tax=Chitinophaga qingshengii TaxID=1569794 RepID=A0ABR7TL75_9BACT|nr:PKD-like domain-containing protein [Chitinophaga qingshengii]MBC9930164.1 hypothetical protein [Chitinophaga qingshengii]
MKKIYFLKLIAAALLLAAACKKEQYNAPDISGTKADTIILNLGDKMVLAPNITNLKGNEYAWSVNGKETATGQVNYTFEATAAGNYEVTFKANNKGGSGEQVFRILVEKQITIAIDELPAVPMCQVTDITPVVTGPDRFDYQYLWTIGDSVIGKKRNLSFIAPQAGTYELTLRTTAGKQTTTATRKITVTAAQYNNNAYMVLEYAPSPAKNHNWSVIGSADSWKYGAEYPLTYNDFLAKATALRKDSKYPMLVIGSWGGSATFKFDHTVANAPDKAELELTAICSQADAPTVYVAYDRNKNGKADADEWYEIKNDDTGLGVIPNYEMTFTYLKTDKDEKRIYTSFSWKDNQTQSAQGEVLTNKTFSSSMTSSGAFSTRGFFPGLSMVDIASKNVAILDGWKNSFTRKGKRITKNLTGTPSFQQTLNIDIDMAVNDKGEYVQLPGIDFVKIQKAVYPVELVDGQRTDVNMEEGRMLHVGGILDKTLKN